MNLDLGLTREIIAECQKQKLNLQEAAYVLATAYWETARTMLPVEEGFYLKNPKAFQKKLRYYPFFGRGLVQLTHEENYRKAGNVLGVDFVAKPALVMDNKYAVLILVTGMRKGWFTGVQLDDNIDAVDGTDLEDGREFEAARRGVNGTDKKKEIAHIALAYEKDLKEFGYDHKNHETEAPSEDNHKNTPGGLNNLNSLIHFVILLLKAIWGYIRR